MNQINAHSDSLETDWFGLWYKIMKERGDNDCPSFVRINTQTLEKFEMNFSHSEMDGVGALYKHYVLDRGIPIPFPAHREKSPPNFFLLLKSFFAFIFLNKKHKTLWKESNWHLNPTGEDAKKFSYEILSTECTMQLENFCKKHSLSLNSVLISIFNAVLLPQLSINKKGMWTIPVNLRGPIQRQDFTSNHSSAILIRVQHNNDLSELIANTRRIQSNIKFKLQRKEHWMIWSIHHIGKYLGYKFMRWVSHQNAKKSFVLGSFSNLGKWDLPPGEIWVGGPPGSRNYPLSVMIFQNQNQISLSLKIHPFVLEDQSQVPTLLKKIVEHIMGLH